MKQKKGETSTKVQKKVTINELEHTLKTLFNEQHNTWNFKELRARHEDFSLLMSNIHPSSICLKNAMLENNKKLSKRI